MPHRKHRGPATDRAEQCRGGATGAAQGGGAIRGIGEKFGANPVTGTGSLSIPIPASPGRDGFGPSLTLTYDSGSGNGPFGFGWTLRLASITRRTDRGLPRYRDAAESDVFILADTEDLVPVLTDAGTRFEDRASAPATSSIVTGPAGGPVRADRTVDSAQRRRCALALVFPRQRADDLRPRRPLTHPRPGRQAPHLLLVGERDPRRQGQRNPVRLRRRERRRGPARTGARTQPRRPR
ncbi:virulence plasmid 65kDa B family protein [Mycobacterium kansasii 824]|nr:virulence plasmid 65kDa B family protein [Mycobacterium kansasii 824]